MNRRNPPQWPFATKVLPCGGRPVGDAEEQANDILPAAYHYYEPQPNGRKRRILADPAEDIAGFLYDELWVGGLDDILKHLWFAGSKHIPTQLHLQHAMGRNIIIADRMDMHLIWDNNTNTIFLKPLPGYLLDPSFWRRHLACVEGCACGESRTADEDVGLAQMQRGSADKVKEDVVLSSTCRQRPRQIALGFIYSYACLVCCESDFFLANERRLLPRIDEIMIRWSDWKDLVRELLQSHDPNLVHPRFLRAELRLSRIETINRLTRASAYNSYLRGWRSYGSLFRANLTWIAAATVFLALVLTAMQVGLAMEQLQGNDAFQAATYGFTVFSILGPMCAFGFVLVAALINLIMDTPWLFRDFSASVRKPSPPV